MSRKLTQAFRQHVVASTTAVVCIAAVVLAATLTAQGRGLVKSALFIPSLIPGTPIQPIDWVTRSPRERSVSFSSGDNHYDGDLYLPATKGPHPALVLSIGVTTNLNDPRVRDLGQALARMGVIAFAPSSPGLLHGQIEPRQASLLASAFQYLLSHAGVDRRHVGFLGICVGSSLSLIASEEPQIASQVNFVIWFDGYYRLDELLASTITHSYVQAGSEETGLSWLDLPVEEAWA